LWLQSAAEENRTIYAKVVERAGNLDLGLEIEVGIGELLALT
jgi:fructose/tagatose bisphosphate aldolase